MISRFTVFLISLAPGPSLRFIPYNESVQLVAALQIMLKRITMAKIPETSKQNSREIK